MNIFRLKKLKNWKIAFIILLFGIVILGISILGGGEIVFATGQTRPMVETEDPLVEVPKMAGGLLGLATSIAASILTLVAGLINFALKFGKEVINLEIVKTGSQTVLAFANLGFVLAIIIIAFATIFRVQSYAMKQTLWKLIVAALLVNFSLVIAGAFINVSNILTDFFLSKSTGADLATGLAGVLKPQALAKVNPDPSIWQKIKGVLDIEYWFKYVASLFFVLISTFLIIITFIAFFIMLLIRAIYLAILLIIMPIVWLLWIFPSTQKYWQEWWNNFIRWTFFAPIMLFFTYLVVTTGKGLNELQAIKNIGGEGNISTAFQGGLMLDPGFFAHVAQLVVVCGLLIGGLMTANKLSITFAGAAYGAAQGAGKTFSGWVGRLGPRAGAGLLRTTGAGQRMSQGINNRIQQWQQQHPGQALPRRLRLLQNVGRATQRATAYRAPGLIKSVWDGMKSGSGLFKGRKAVEWGCRHCGNVIKSVKMPTRNCPSCNNPPDWEKLATA